jgi:hypothetical protein
VGRAAPSEKGSEIQQADVHVVQFVSQTAAHLDIVLNAFTPGVHRSPPGQTNARVASEVMSTLA